MTRVPRLFGPSGFHSKDDYYWFLFENSHRREKFQTVSLRNEIKSEFSENHKFENVNKSIMKTFLSFRCHQDFNAAMN